MQASQLSRRQILSIGLPAALRATDSARITWTAGPTVLEAGPAGAFDSVSVKDPSIVFHRGAWHLFYTARSASDYTLGCVSAARFEDFARAPRHSLKQLHSAHSKYAAAPQVFYFRPQKKWYLIYQTVDSNYQPVYSTTSNIADPASWTPALPLVNKSDSAKWIDFWVICDSDTAYLFFTRAHHDVVVMTTKLTAFPHGFSGMKTVFAPVHEAVHVYAVRGASARYVMIYEQQDGDLRRFGLARAGSLSGPWTEVDGQFVTGGQLAYPPRQQRWTDEISHGELLRASSGERIEIPSDQWRLLVQGMPRESHKGGYVDLPWRLGLITARPGPTN